jgi:sodium/bile acid cotransporter 7
LWNMVGVFLSPILILGYIGQTGSVNRWMVFIKLAIRVFLPIVIGQLLKWFVPPVNVFVKKYKPYFKQAQMYSLVFIVYTIFCRTFADNVFEQVPVKDIFIMIAFIAISLSILMVFAWYLMQLLFKKEVKLRVTGLYACTHKTAAMGIPLINAIYEGDPKIGLYTLPLLIWHPMQLVIGTLLTPRLHAWVESFELDDDLALEVVDTEAKKLEADDAAGEVVDSEAQKLGVVDTEDKKVEGVDAPSDELSAVSIEVDV